MAKDSLPAKYRDNCRAELIALNAERDSVQKIETRFRDDVIRLAETFSKIELNSERLRLAKKFFDEGKISEADNVLKEKDMAATGDAALAAKARNDSVLLQTANEFALKAQLKALKMDYDSAQILFAQSRKYFETVDNLWEFGNLLYYQNQSHRAIEYFEKALKLARSESEEASLAMNLGVLYSDIQKMAEAEKMYLRSLEIRERLAKSSPAQFEPDLALTLNNFCFFRQENGQFEEAKKMYSRALALRQKAVANGQTYFWSKLGRVYANMGALRDSFASRGDWAAVAVIQRERAACMEALKDIHATAAKRAPQDYGSLSWYCLFARQYPESQAAAERALSLDPTKNWVRTNLGHSHLLRGDWDKAKAVYETYLKNEPDPDAGKKTLLKDWDDLEKAGAVPKERMGEVEKARKWVRE
jgi:tetratricopeptide (TPR) repeat protein